MMVICQTGTSVDEVFTNWKPESTPVTAPAASVMLEHGAAKVDWVTVWFLSRNWNWTTSPSATPVSLGREDGEEIRKRRPESAIQINALVGVVSELTTADLDDVRGREGSTNGQESSNDSGETHLELWGRERTSERADESSRTVGEDEVTDSRLPKGTESDMHGQMIKGNAD